MRRFRAASDSPAQAAWIPRRAVSEVNGSPCHPLPAGAPAALGESRPTNRHRLVVVGGGFAGVAACQHLRKAPVDITLLDRRNFHLFQPLLYQVATGALSPANIAEPLRTIFAKQRNVTTLLGEAVDLDPEAGTLTLQTGQILPFDSLLVAVGAKGSYFGNDHWGEHAPGLKTLEDATEMRRKVFSAFEAAERTDDPLVRQAMLTFVIVGGGPTGTELAGTLAEIAHETLRDEFRRICPSDATIILVQSGDRILKGYPDKLSVSAADKLGELGVSVRLGSRVVDVADDHVKVKTGDRVDAIPTCTVLWAAGVQAAKFTHTLAQRLEAQVDRGGQILSQPDLTVAGHPNVFVAGDMCHFKTTEGSSLPGVAQVAMQQGKHVAKTIRARLDEEPAPGAFEYRDLGQMAMLGRNAAVADIGPYERTGFVAWLIWLFIHLVSLVTFRSRLLVLIQWAYSYVMRKRSARLITQTPALIARTTGVGLDDLEETPADETPTRIDLDEASDDASESPANGSDRVESDRTVTPVTGGDRIEAAKRHQREATNAQAMPVGVGK